MAKFTSEQFRAAVEKAIELKGACLRILGYEILPDRVHINVKSRSGKSNHQISYYMDEEGHISRSRCYYGETGVTILGNEIIDQLWGPK